jgi:hypothetical protein
MEQQAKRAIKSLVLELRKKLEGEIAVQLKRYGFSRERWLPLERLPHIQEDDQATIDHFRLKAALEQHLRRIGAEPEKPTAKQQAEAVDWFVRELAFTHLNRLVALKCLEVRNLIPEIITTRDAYGGRSCAHHDYRSGHQAEGAQPDDGLPAAIRHACRQVYAEFRFLFDVGDPATGRAAPSNSILWPSYPALRECIALINGLDKAAGHEDGTLWSEDEIIGWIYQFYNAEEKQAIRKRGRPRVAAEVAVINQFFTPRWIVKFLVDNTLGRLWLEMHPDSERVRPKCDYLVPEPLSVDDDESGESDDRKFHLDPDSPINDSGAPPRRDPKRPQDLRLIDPACGTMHFGHYAFEVFREIYRDAREHNWVSDSDALSDDDIPDAILRHNLYGVDIDLRAVQLAGLSLFIKAKTANPNAAISQVNLVVADAVLPDDGSRQRFLDQYKDDKVVQDAVRQVLEEMADVAEMGSLLRVEERLRDILTNAGHAAVQDWDRRRAQELPGFETSARQLSLAELPNAEPDQWGAHYTLARLLDDLREFAAEALQTHDLNAQLFAEEAQKTVHLLDVLLNDYDVVVMNPPYGHTTDAARVILSRQYPDSKGDLYTAFTERDLALLGDYGYIGALTSRTFLNLLSLQRFRQRILLPMTHLSTLLDFGFGILDDATVETAAWIVSNSPEAPSPSVFLRLSDCEPGEYHRAALEALTALSNGRCPDHCYLADVMGFSSLPGNSFAYWAPASVVDKFASLPHLRPAYGDAIVGLQTSDDSRFLRRYWEVAHSDLGRGHRWIRFSKGGDFSRYYYDFDLVILWEDDGKALKESGRAYIRNERFYFSEGLSYPLTTVKGFSIRHLPEDHIWGHVGPAVIPSDSKDLWFLLGILNSELAQAFLSMTVSRNFEVGFLRELPVPAVNRETHARLVDLARTIYQSKAGWDTGNETSSHFQAPWLIQGHNGGLARDFQDLDSEVSRTDQLTDLLIYVREVEHRGDARLHQLQSQIDEAVYELYDISPQDRILIQRELRDRPPELAWPQTEGKSDTQKRREHVRRLISYFLLEALKESRDGILPLTAGTGQPAALDKVRQAIEEEFGEQAVFKMESDIKEVLGKSIADWLDRDFFKWHIKLYKRRPMIWHLASARNSFACLIHIHKLDRDTLRKVQTQYVWPARRTIEAELESAKAQKDSRAIERAEAALNDLADFEERLLSVIRAELECDIPDWAEGPFRGGVYDPVLDDGVKVNITPLQEAGLLRSKNLVS